MPDGTDDESLLEEASRGDVVDPEVKLYDVMMNVVPSKWKKQQLYQIFLELGKSST